jgi:hypothetical protein
MNQAKFVESLKTVPPVECAFFVGDVVTFKNDYGVSFEGLTILGFADEPLHGRFIHLDTDCWWFPVRPESLKKQ